MNDFSSAIEGMTKEEKKYVLSRSYPLFAAYYFDLRVAPFHATIAAHWQNTRRSLTLVPMQHGKALGTSTPIATPSGWATMGDLRVGDEVFSDDGKPCHVTAVMNWEDRPLYRVHTNDGENIIADAEHEWLATCDIRSKPKLHTTQEVSHVRKQKMRTHLAQPLNLPDADLEITPYVLGLWLGDGHTACGRITIGDEDWLFLENEIHREGYELGPRNVGKAATIYGLQPQLRKAGVLGDKRIPEKYLRASAEQRLALLQGLVDSDGHVAIDRRKSPEFQSGQVEFCSTNLVLAYDVLELVRTLGVKATLRRGRATLNGKDCGEKYRVCFYREDAARLPRKRERCRRSEKFAWHYLSAEYIGQGESVCIEVDAPSHLFLAGYSMVPTHNSTTMKIDAIRNICLNPNVRIIITTATADDAAEYVRSIESELMGNKKLIEDFGPFYNPSRWTNSGFRISGCQHNNPHDTLETFGDGGWNQKGHGCEIVYVDDIVTEDTCLTPEARAKQLRKFNMAVLSGPRSMWNIDKRYGLEVPPGIDWPKDAPYNPVPGQDADYGQTIVMGTCFHPHDLYYELQYGKHQEDFSTLHLDCFWDYNKNEADKTETMALWQDVWPITRLLSARSTWGPLDFGKRFQNRAIDESEIIFKREWFEGNEEYPGCLDRTRSFGDIPKDDNGEEMDLFKVLGFDPASGEATKYAAWPTFDLLGFPRGGDAHKDTRYIIDVFRQQIGPEGLLDIMFDGGRDHYGFYKRYKYDICKVETNGFATLLTGHHRVTEAKRVGVVIEPHTTGRNKLDPVAGVKSMEQIFRDGLVSIPYKTEHDRKIANEVIDQFVYFSFSRTGRRRSLTDYVMAFWFAELVIRKNNDRPKSIRHPNSHFTVINKSARRNRLIQGSAR